MLPQAGFVMDNMAAVPQYADSFFFNLQTLNLLRIMVFFILACPVTLCLKQNKYNCMLYVQQMKSMLGCIHATTSN